MIYKQILEAVNRGISLSLDDFENIEDNIKSQSDIINSTEDDKIQFCKHIILPKIFKDQHKLLEFYYVLILRKNNLDLLDKSFKEIGLSYIESKILIDYLKIKNILYREYVDLNLPSRTLWCTENLEEMDYEFTVNGVVYRANEGSYYIWGNTKPNPLNAGGDKIIKLKNSYIKDISDKSKTEILLNMEDDASYNVNNHYRIPTSHNFTELFKNTNIIKLKLNNYTQTLGYILASKKDPLKFIWFPYEADRLSQLYLTSNLTRLGNSINTYMNYAKLKQEDNTLKLGIQAYDVWHYDSIPGVIGRIRPIFVE